MFLNNFNQNGLLELLVQEETNFNWVWKSEAVTVLEHPNRPQHKQRLTEKSKLVTVLEKLNESRWKQKLTELLAESYLNIQAETDTTLVWKSKSITVLEHLSRSQQKWRFGRER